MILGIDEAGRGPWAGPLVVGAVVLGGASIEGLTDSKKLSKKKRELIYEEIVQHALAYASGWVSAAELDEIGMSAALRLATRRAVEQIEVAYSEIIIDGTVNFLAETGKGAYVQTMAKADLLVPSVSAASVVAKVERDRYMARLDEEYPGYGFGAHAGYGVAKHRTAIEELGVTSEHRLSFAPLVKYRASSTPLPSSTSPLPDKSSTTASARSGPRSSLHPTSPPPPPSFLRGRSTGELCSACGAWLALAGTSPSKGGDDDGSTVIERIALREIGQRHNSSTTTLARVTVCGAAPDLCDCGAKSGADRPAGPESSDLRGNSEGIGDDGSGVNTKATTREIGDKAESVVAGFLRADGHEIVARNWRTKFCEIDIVSRRDDTVYFTEVKYRKRPDQGGGLAAITPKKLRQMRFAAEYFALKEGAHDVNLRLAVADVAGEDFALGEWTPLD